MKIISWNLLRLVGASPDEVADLVAREAPDVLLMQEATAQIDRLPQIIGGHYMRRLLPGRVHGLAVWSRQRPVAAPTVVVLPQGSMFRRIGLVVDLGDFSVANVHLSHGQVLNRRQLWRIASTLPPRAAVLGDFNDSPEAAVVRSVAGDLADMPRGRHADLELTASLERGILHHCVKAVPPGQRHTILYRGVGQQVDHILVSRALWRRFRGARVLNENLRDGTGEGREDVESDHAAVVATFS